MSFSETEHNWQNRIPDEEPKIWSEELVTDIARIIAHHVEKNNYGSRNFKKIHIGPRGKFYWEIRNDLSKLIATLKNYNVRSGDFIGVELNNTNK